jgi:hypothetical protein
MTDQGGSVMRASTVYTIFWAPGGYTFPDGYESTINQYFQDVAHDSGGASNAFSVATQYSDFTGQISYDQTFGGTADDTQAYPTSGCSVPSDVVGHDTMECLSDDQLQAEVKRFADAQGWSGGPNVQFVLYTPPNVASCFDFGLPVCSYDVFCAYHSAFFDNSSDEYIYANLPYPNQSVTLGGATYTSDCDGGEHPNSADQTSLDDNAPDESIDSASHEVNEAVTDPLGDGWWVTNPKSQFFGYEIADLCSFSWLQGDANTGALGGNMSDGTAYDQVINGHHYFTQGEWSNSTATKTPWSGCVWSYGGPVYGGGAGISGTLSVGQTVTASAGTWSGSPTSYTYVWYRCDQFGDPCVKVGTRKTSAATATYVLQKADDKSTLEIGVTAVNPSGTSPAAISEPTFPVGGEPEGATPSINGTAIVGNLLSVNLDLAHWTNNPTSFKVVWTRVLGGQATTLLTSVVKPGATPPSYKLKAADDKALIYVDVTASNAVGPSDPAETFVGPVGGEPANTAVPTISGTAKVGQTLTGSPGTWSFTPTKYTYIWRRCAASGSTACTVISTVTTTATSSTYTPVAADVGSALRLRVTATNAIGTSDPVTSAPTAVVTN